MFLAWLADGVKRLVWSDLAFGAMRTQPLHSGHKDQRNDDHDR
jgi:hypothetical protein